MKKVVALILVFAMLAPAAFADSAVSDRLEQVLLAVKSKVDIPSELSEFESDVMNHNGKTVYHFDWHDTAYEKSIAVSADENDHVLSYYNHANDSSRKKLSGVSKSEIIAFADAFLERTVPEMYSDTSDILVFDEESYSADGNQRYSLTYNRYKNSVPVKDNRINITVCISEDDILYVRSMYANIDFDTPFEPICEEAFDYRQKYIESFPVELVYKNEYNPDWKVTSGLRTIPMLIYRIKDDNAGFISLENGEIIAEDRDEGGVYRDESSADVSMGAMEKNESLTEKELAEITAVEGLMSVAEIEKIIKKLPHVKLPEGFRLTNSSLSKNTAGKYIYNLHYKSDEDGVYGYFYAAVYAEDGKLLSLYCRDDKEYNKAGLTAAQQTEAAAACEEFLREAAETELESVIPGESEASGVVVSTDYHRVINGVKHITDGISISYNAAGGYITGFSLNFTEGEFANPQEAVPAETAYENLLAYSPIVRMYVKSGGKYIECATLETHGVMLDAITGEIKNADNNENQSFSYSDISGHWVEEAAAKLAEIQVGLEGESLNPDASVTQEEFLRLAASGIYGKYYHTYSTDELYESMIREKVITEDEKTPAAFITREDAFVYIIRMANLDKVAKLENIYKVDYRDSNLLSSGKIGYCAILSGLGVICGDGGYLRPTDKITRAEAVIMVYRYLLTE